MIDWEPVIGLELHVQLATKSKIFSGTSTAFGAPPNSQASAIDLGLPGVLPVLNERAVRMAVTFGLAIGARINERSHFDRKNYFYPDLPKGYQISQFQHPIVGEGLVTIALDDGTVRDVRITRAHLEEDAGKSIHDAYAGMTGVDLNRTGTPLLEVVSEPDLRSPEQASAYFRHMHALVRALRICDGDLSQGSMRCDANVSVRPRGATKLGVRTELKNINSFRFVEIAVRGEIERQIALLERGGTVARETRGFDATTGTTYPMRGKELSDDYRYFPDPDLLPVVISPEYIAALRDAMPELPEARAERYTSALQLSAYDAARLCADPDLADYFETVVATSGVPKLAANWVLGELSAALNRSELAVADAPVTPQLLGELIQRITKGVVSGTGARSAFEALWQGEGTLDEIIASHGLEQIDDDEALTAAIADVIARHPDQVAQIRAGKDKVLGFLVGQVMKATAGKANPARVSELLRATLAAG
jgi:aspartyl-tRNA(Asn)/glutamyl-tRNA(Gln) amidotransferase subunit B